MADQPTGFVPDGFVADAPHGSAATRKDADGIVGVDRSGFVSRAADFASKFPSSLQRPVAMGAELGQEIGANALEMISDPASIAGMLTGPFDAALTALGKVRNAASVPADLIIESAARKLGVDPDAMNLAATRMRLQAARARTRISTAQAAMAKQAGAQAPPVAAEAPAAAPMSAPAPTAATARPMLAAPEAKLYFVLRAQGKTDAQAKAAIEAGRAMAASSSFANLPTNIDVAKGVDVKNATGTWPQ